MALPTLLLLCMDVCAVQAVRLAQLLPFLHPHPFLTLWGGGLLRASLLLLLTLSPGCPQWLKGQEGVRILGVHSFLSPAYITLLRISGQSTLELLWGWHSWLGVCVHGHIQNANCMPKCVPRQNEEHLTRCDQIVWEILIDYLTQ